MNGSFLTVKEASETQCIIHKSRFIGRCFPVQSEEEALSLLADIRKEYWDAAHNCFAYRIGETASTARFSDDGEPAGTAGKPIMDVLSGRGVTDVLCVVTRYFGGVLLGAGGLVRAYGKSAALSLEEAGIIQKVRAAIMRIIVEYPLYSMVEAFVKANGKLIQSTFSEHVTLEAAVPELKSESFKKSLIELTNGKVQIETTQIAHYVELGYNMT